MSLYPGGSSSSGSSTSNLGQFADETALNEAYPTSTTGSYAYVLDTTSYWYYDEDTGWADSGSSSSGDMQTDIYDPTGIGDDAFQRSNHYGTQTIATITDLQTTLDSKADSDDVYTTDELYTQTEVDSLLSDKADSSDVYTTSQLYTQSQTDALLLTKASDDDLEDLEDRVTTLETDGVDTYASGAVSVAKLDNPLSHLFKKNDIASVVYGGLDFSRSTTATYHDRYGILRTVDADTPRETGDGWLLEQDSENVITYSGDLTQWTLGDSTTGSIATESGISDPDNSSSAYVLTQGTEESLQNVYLDTSIESSTTYTYSVYMKQGTSTYGYIAFPLTLVDASEDTTYPAIGVDLSSGLAFGIADSIESYLIEEVINSWFRISITATTHDAISSGSFYVGMLNSASITDHTFTGDGSTYIYVAKAQLEAQEQRTSYIATDGDTSTRDGEIVSISGFNNISDFENGFSITGNVSKPAVNLEEEKTLLYISDDVSPLKLVFCDEDSSNYLKISLTDSAYNVETLISELDYESVDQAYFAITIGSGEATFYINDEEVGTLTATSGKWYTDWDIDDVTVEFNTTSGSIITVSDVRLYDSELSSDDVSYLTET